MQQPDLYEAAIDLIGYGRPDAITKLIASARELSEAFLALSTCTEPEQCGVCLQRAKDALQKAGL